MIRFSTVRAVISVILFLILIYIAFYVDDRFVRPFLGDVIVVIWLYFCTSTVISYSPLRLGIGVAVVSYLVEFIQHTAVFSLENYPLLRIALGSTYDWLDILAYTVGATICVLIDSGLIAASTFGTYQG
ncbi:ribosomal maturation YjgA family protein [Vibrio sp. SCSIO 43137]|uniref:ribosomal maturation YjgA family protein n=1 Tax=Vibrio sp. SCSIO 43137 TaxID=3021011 RepID=UPI0023071032|nr:DUF2809 domain-containing protein [Vibrio sp. SCSIO 43137]WCE32472.1 DUF2809 domain-containing protein [Vibrio sp. SCSIO 43137]